MKTFEIYLCDLKPEAQRELLEFFGDEINEYFPIATIDIEEDKK